MKDTDKEKGNKTMIIFILSICIFYNSIKFIGSDAAKNSVLSTLFNMIIILFIIILIIHKDDIDKKNYINRPFWKIISQLNSLIV